MSEARRPMICVPSCSRWRPTSFPCASWWVRRNGSSFEPMMSHCLPMRARVPGATTLPRPLRHVQKHAVRGAFVAHPVAVGSGNDGRVPLGEIGVVREADVAAAPTDGADPIAGKFEQLGLDLAVDETHAGGGPGRRRAVRTKHAGRSRKAHCGSARQFHLHTDVGRARQPLADGLDHRDAVGQRGLDVAAMLDLAKRRGVAGEVAALEVRGVEGCRR